MAPEYRRKTKPKDILFNQKLLLQQDTSVSQCKILPLDQILHDISQAEAGNRQFPTNVKVRTQTKALKREMTEYARNRERGS